MLRPGFVVEDRYRLEEQLAGRGGSSTWKAVDVGTGGPCVVKALSVAEVIAEHSGAFSYDGDDFTKLIDLFEREARVLANLDHPSVPSLLDHFRVEVDGATWLFSVQEYIEGDTLEDLVASGRHFTEDEARQILLELLDIVADLHDRSPPLIHRDIKPSNVIVGETGRVHLVDFGSVRNVREPDVLDGKTIVGTYGYMPIEQYEGRAVPQSDFYALGMTLVYLLSHKDPTQISRTGLTLDFRSHVNISDGFADTLRWMIAAAPEDRPPDAHTIIEALADQAESVSGPGLLARLLPTGADGQLLRFLAPLASGVIGFTLFFTFAVPDRPDPPPPPVAPGPAPASTTAESDAATDPVLAVDIDRDFRYVDRGWPMGRSVGQTTLPPLVRTPRTPLTLPDRWSPDESLFGQVVLGDGDDNRYDFVIGRNGFTWSILIDRDNDEDLSDEGLAMTNQGDGDFLAVELTLDVTVRRGADTIVRPYAFWIWFTESQQEGRLPYGRMYSRHHYSGSIALDGQRYMATAFEQRNHDGMLRNDGLCIDLNQDRRCQEASELFYHGDLVPSAGGGVRLSLVYP